MDTEIGAGNMELVSEHAGTWTENIMTLVYNNLIHDSINTQTLSDSCIYVRLYQIKYTTKRYEKYFLFLKQERHEDIYNTSNLSR